VGQVPPAVAARVFHAGAEHPAAPLVRPRADAVDVVGAERFLGPDHLDPAAGDRLGAPLAWCLSCRVHVCSPKVGPGARTQEATAAAGRSPLVVTREPATASGAAPPLAPAGSNGWSLPAARCPRQHPARVVTPLTGPP